MRLNMFVKAASLCALCSLGVCLIGCDSDNSPVNATVAEEEVAQSTGKPLEHVDANAEAAKYSKSEIVYALLSNSGALESAYVVNRFEVSKPGLITDHGSYDLVSNMTNTAPIEFDDSTILFEAQDNVFFYQGNMKSAVLPWNIEFNYELNGSKVAAEELAGASGNLVIRAWITPNETSQLGKKEAAAFQKIRESFMTQLTFTFPGNAISKLKAKNATIASSGSDRTVAFTTLPGKTGSFEIQAKIENFSMGSIQVVALPYTTVISTPDTASLTDSMRELSDAISELNDGTAELASGAETLAEGADTLSEGSTALGDGLVQISRSSNDLTSASTEIYNALDTMALQMGNANFSQLGDLATLADNLNQIAGALEELSKATGTTLDGYRASFDALDKLLGPHAADGKNTAVSKADIEALYTAIGASASDKASQAKETVDQLVKSYETLQIVQGSWLGKSGKGTDGIRAAFMGADQLMAQLSASAETEGSLKYLAAQLKLIAQGLEGSDLPGAARQLEQLAQGLGQLSSNYRLFNEGLGNYTSGVDTLASNYAEFDEGVTQLAEGTHDLSKGTSDLSEGTGKLHKATINMPEEMQAEIDDMMADYDFPPFEKTSYVSPKNKHTNEVQFVMTTPAIDLPEEEQQA